LLLFFRVTLADLTFLTPDWDAFKCYWYRFGRFQNTGNHPSRFENRQNAIGSNSFVPFLSRDTLSKPNVVFRFRQNLALLQPRLDIFLDYLDKLGIRRYPILVVAHTSHEEHWTVTNENLILVGPRHEQGITVTWFSARFRSLCQHFFLHSSWRRHRLHLKAKRALPV
jgi:hypothetical protein